IDARSQEQSRKLRRLLWSAHLLLHPLVVIDGAVRRDELVGQAVIDDELAAPVTEPRQIRIVRSEDGAVLLDRLPPEQFKSRRRQCRPVPLRILEQEELEPLQRDAERFSCQRRTARASEGEQVRAARQTVPKECSILPARAFPELAD